NKQVVGNTQESTLTKVDLNPHYDISLFRDIPIPDGTLVYEVKDGEIINQYKQGEQTNPHWPPSRPFPWHWLVGPAVGLVLVAGWFTYRWWSRKRNRAPAAA